MYKPQKQLLIASYGANLRRSVFIIFFSIKTREFESVETCPRFARESSIGTLYSIHDFEKKNVKWRKFRTESCIFTKKSQVTRKRSSILLKKAASERKTGKLTAFDNEKWTARVATIVIVKSMKLHIEFQVSKASPCHIINRKISVKMCFIFSLTTFLCPFLRCFDPFLVRGFDR